MHQTSKTQVLIVEDEPAHAEMICRNLQTLDTLSVRIVSTLDACRQAITDDPPAIILIDLHLPDGSAVDLLGEIEQKFPLLTMTSRGSETLAVEALKAGALDYIVKSPETFVAMPRIVERALREWQLRLDNKQAIMALRESEMRFRTLLQDIRSIAVQGYQADGTVHYWNKAAEDLYGYQAEEALGKNLLDLIIPATIGDDFLETSRRMVETGELEAAEELTLRHKDGSLIDVYSSQVVVRDGDHIARIFCFDVDISARKAMERLLREQKSLVDGLLQNSATPIYVLDPHHRVIVWNKACEELTGVKAEQVIGTRDHWKAFYEQERPCLADVLLDGSDLDLLHSLYENGREGGFHDEELQAEGWYHKLGGADRYLSFNAALVRDEFGAIVAAIQTLQDITERKKSEDKTRSSREELLLQHERLDELFHQVEQAKQEWETTLDCIDDIVILADANGKIRRFNRPLGELTGLSFHELLGRPWFEVVELSGFEEKVFPEQGLELYHPDSQRWFLVTCYPFTEPEHNGVTGMVVSLHERTAIKKITAELEQANRDLKQAHLQQLQSEKMASVGQLAAGVAHEINNPIGFVASNLGTLEKYLAKITAFLALQEQELATQGDAEQLKRIAAQRHQMKIDSILGDLGDLVAESRDGVARVGKIVRDLKSFSRVDEAEHKMADVIECLESSINIVWNELKYKATLTRDFAELPPILCFPGQLNQVFVNLLVNAAQAIETRGTIDLKGWAENDQVVIQITDSGCGISEENCQRIFDPFFTTKEVGKGTGLGLSISYDIIKKHQGEISVASRPGQGTSFTIRLPLHDSAAVARNN